VTAAGIDAFSLDVIDGRFAPRTTFGEDVVASVRGWTGVPLEVHLMVERPETWVRPMCAAGADMVVFHLEATNEPLAVVEQVHAEGRAAGVALTVTPVTRSATSCHAADRNSSRSGQFRGAASATR
jgi:ribulose-phosphate 3-epimerase